MELYHRDYGGKGHQPLVLLHGLLGSSRNWVTVGRLLAEHFHVFGLDLRNHGLSPHDDEMSYAIMVQDTLDWLDQQKLEKVHLVGHSMGGKVAMLLAVKNPERVQSLTIADIAPKSYEPHFRLAFDAMHAVQPQKYTRIADVEAALADHLQDAMLRQFLVTNLARNKSGTFDWQINLNGITQALPELSENPIDKDAEFSGPAQLLFGDQSDFVKPEDWTDIMFHFPSCKRIEVPNSGHNVHVENRHFFANQMSQFLVDSKIE